MAEGMTERILIIGKVLEKRQTIYAVLGLQPGERGPHSSFAAGYVAAMDDVLAMLTGKPAPSTPDTLGERER